MRLTKVTNRNMGEGYLRNKTYYIYKHVIGGSSAAPSSSTHESLICPGGWDTLMKPNISGTSSF